MLRACLASVIFAGRGGLPSLPWQGEGVMGLADKSDLSHTRHWSQTQLCFVLSFQWLGCNLVFRTHLSLPVSLEEKLGFLNRNSDLGLGTWYQRPRLGLRIQTQRFTNIPRREFDNLGAAMEKASLRSSPNIPVTAAGLAGLKVPACLCRELWVFTVSWNNSVMAANDAETGKLCAPGNQPQY